MYIIRKKKLIELQITVDLSTSEYIYIDLRKLDSLLEEISELMEITLEKAELFDEERVEEIMKEFMVKDESSV